MAAIIHKWRENRVVRSASVGIRALTFAAMIPFCGAQSIGTTLWDPWPAVPDQSAKPYVRISFSSQGAQAQRDAAGGVIHGFQVVHYSALCRSQECALSAAAVYQAAIFAGFLVIGPYQSQASLEGPAKRGKWAAIGRALDIAPGGVALGLALSGAPVQSQVVTAGTALVLQYLRAGVVARKVDPQRQVQAILQEIDSQGHPVMLRMAAGEGASGDIGAQYHDTQDRRAVLIDIRADGSMSISGTN